MVTKPLVIRPSIDLTADWGVDAFNRPKIQTTSSFFQEAKEKTVFVHLYDGSLFFPKYLKYVKSLVLLSDKNFGLRKQF